MAADALQRFIRDWSDACSNRDRPEIALAWRLQSIAFDIQPAATTRAESGGATPGVVLDLSRSLAEGQGFGTASTAHAIAWLKSEPSLADPSRPVLIVLPAIDSVEALDNLDLKGVCEALRDRTSASHAEGPKPPEYVTAAQMSHIVLQTDLRRETGPNDSAVVETQLVSSGFQILGSARSALANYQPDVEISYRLTVAVPGPVTTEELKDYSSLGPLADALSSHDGTGQCCLIELSTGDLLFVQSNVSEGLFAVLNGSLKVYFSWDYEKSTIDSQAALTVGRGQPLGDLELFLPYQNARYEGTAVAAESGTKVLRISRELFEELKLKHGQTLGFWLYSRLADNSNNTVPARPSAQHPVATKILSNLQKGPKRSAIKILPRPSDDRKYRNQIKGSETHQKTAAAADRINRVWRKHSSSWRANFETYPREGDAADFFMSPALANIGFSGRTINLLVNAGYIQWDAGPKFGTQIHEMRDLITAVADYAESGVSLADVAFLTPAKVPKDVAGREMSNKWPRDRLPMHATNIVAAGIAYSLKEWLDNDPAGWIVDPYSFHELSTDKPEARGVFAARLEEVLVAGADGIIDTSDAGNRPRDRKLRAAAAIFQAVMRRGQFRTPVPPVGATSIAPLDAVLRRAEEVAVELGKHGADSRVQSDLREQFGLRSAHSS